MKGYSISVIAALLALPAPAIAQQLNVAVVPGVTASNAASLVVKAGPGTLYRVEATNHTAFDAEVMVLDLSSLPVLGAVSPIACEMVNKSSSVVMTTLPTPGIKMQKGITIAFSTSVDCFTLSTGSVTGFISAIAQ